MVYKEVFNLFFLFLNKEENTWSSQSSSWNMKVLKDNEGRTEI